MPSAKHLLTSRKPSHRFIQSLFIVTAAFLWLASAAWGAQVTLAWDASTGDIAGYKMHYGTSSGNYTASINAGNKTTCTVPNLTPGTTYYFAVTAYASDNTESGYSNQVSHTVPDAVTLSSITISGPGQVAEAATAQYTCTAQYSDGSTATLSSGVNWSENSSATSINTTGLLTAGSVASDTTVTITASYEGKSDTHTITVTNATPTLSSITISGPTQLDENSSTQYTCTARYSDNSTTTLSSGVTWSENSSATSIASNGLLTAGNVSSDRSVTVTASYGGKSDTHSVTVKNVPPTLSSIAISGPIQVNANSSAQYSCTANYSDGSTSTLTSGVSWTENSSATSISSNGLLTASSVTSDKSVTITASYSGKSDTHSVTIKKVATTLSSLSISGPSRLNESESAQFNCTAHYSDGTSSVITDSVTWSVNSASAGINSAGILTAGAILEEQQLTITASFEGKKATQTLTLVNTNKTCSLTVDIMGSGTVLLNPDGGTYEEGTVVTLTADADLEWAFDGWDGLVADPTAKVTTVVMDADMNLAVTFLEDTDRDSVPDQEEWGRDSLDENFDGNGDGIADYLQSNVVSIHTKDYQQFLTLSTPEPARITACSPQGLSSLTAPPAVCTLTLGLISYTIENLTPGGATTLTFHLPAGSGFDTFYKYGATPDNPAAHWYEFLYEQQSETGTVFEGDSLTLHLKDGQRGDDDLSENGVISDPGGPAMLVTDNPTDSAPGTIDTTTPGASGGSSSGCFIESIFKHWN